MHSPPQSILAHSLGNPNAMTSVRVVRGRDGTVQLVPTWIVQARIEHALLR